MGKTSAFVMVIALAGATPAAQAAETVTYSYDYLGRLTKVVHAGGPASGSTVDLTHDAAANRTRVVSVKGQASGGGGACGFKVLDAAGNGEFSVYVPIERIGTCSGNVVVNWNNGFGGTGQITFTPSDSMLTFRIPPIGCGSATSTATISIAAGSARIDRGAATVDIWESC